MSYELKEYSFEETIGKSFNLYFSNFIILFICSFIINIPSSYISEVLIVDGSSFDNLYNFRNFAINHLSDIITTQILTGFSVIVVTKQFFNENPSITDYLSSFIKILLPILGLSILYTIAVTIGLLLLVIPGIILSFGLSVVNSVLVVEGSGGIAALKRSWDLTTGYKGIIFRLTLVINISLRIFVAIFFVLLEFLSLSENLYLLLYHLIISLITPISACLLVVVYFNLKIKKEGFDLEHLVGQFGNSKDETAPL